MKKRICFFINSGWYFQLHWLDRAKLFLNDGYEVHVIAHFSENERITLNTQGFICHESGMNERSLNFVSASKDFINIIKLLTALNPDILHAITIKPIIIGGIYARFLKKPFVSSFVGLGRVFMNQTITFKLLNIFVRKTYSFIFKNPKSRLTFEHEKDLRLLIDLIQVPCKQCSVIDGVGINLTEYQYRPEVENTPPVVLFAARMLKSKGLEVLVNINKELKLQGESFILNVAGIEIEGDSDAITKEKILEWHRCGLINWLGKRSDIPKLIEECNIVALPSTYFEGVPRIIIEGAATGRACLVYDSGGCNSIINDGVNGYVVRPGDKDEFKEKLLSLFSNPLLRIKMGLQGRRIVEERFSLESVYEKTKSLYLEII
ncbi:MULTISPECIES: glycosyltransferase family 4 protein [Pantoea]|jgi:glycosyltransferase involved in cell wall biosynthesis|uniref:Glycosyltransferase family 4 protein n=1 Tax=Candidatus Pantoea communis TaxID=2608354 RepID=A0ABX0RJS1_9GAMM|nr:MULTISPECIES: glycosyltransferase family 4 protein [Pantoea]NIG17880.1 glycosyltransferase family 4 protein [Pantoea communis]